MSEINRDSAPGARRSDAVLGELDEELKAELMVRPSADFEARVLRRVEADVAGGWSWRRSFALLPAAAALIIAVALAMMVKKDVRVDTPSPVPQIAERSTEPPAGRRVVSAVTRTPAPAIAGRSRLVWVAAPKPRATETGATPAPEVLVPPQQAEAVRRLARAVLDGHLLSVPEPHDGPALPPSEVVVPSLLVEPLPVPSVEPGVDQLPDANPNRYQGAHR